MLRADVEKIMKENKMQWVTLVMNENDTRGMHCFLQGGYLMDCTAHRVDRKKDIWGYIWYDGKGNADKKSFDGKVNVPYMRERKLVK